MYPTALMQALMAVVACIEITAEYAAEVLTDELFDHFSSTQVMVLKIANARRGDTPDVAIDAIFSPPRLIGLDCRTGADLPFERIEVRLHLCFDPVQQFHNLSTADRDSVQREQ